MTLINERSDTSTIGPDLTARNRVALYASQESDTLIGERRFPESTLRPSSDEVTRSYSFPISPQSNEATNAEQTDRFEGILGAEGLSSFESGWSRRALLLWAFLETPKESIEETALVGSWPSESSVVVISWPHVENVTNARATIGKKWVLSHSSLPKVIQAPPWLVQRMQALRQMPPPSLQDVRTSFRAAEETRLKCEGNPNYFASGPTVPAT